MLENIGLGINTIYHMGNGTMPKADKLGKIADYLNVSVDYLLGRADIPQGIIQVNTGNVGNYSNVNVHNKKQTDVSDNSDIISEMVAVFKTLNFCDKTKVMNLIAELSDK
ncbi:MAG: helix-turn-helix domain-containing protein [Ruminococcus sp.]|nr:helix-turn-helix domain-containing protein [Ruminococcus sp.]